MKLLSFWRSLATYRRAHRAQSQGRRAGRGGGPEPHEGRAARGGYRAVDPMMVLPTLIDGEGPILFESLTIIEYLDETHPNPPLLPRDARGRARVRGLAQIVAGDSHLLLWQTNLDRLFVIRDGTVKFAPSLESFAATVVSCRMLRI
jgi:maleylacetoacetate isomerase